MLAYTTARRPGERLERPSRRSRRGGRGLARRRRSRRRGTRRDRRACRGGGLWRDRVLHRPLRRPRPRILHRPRLRGRAHFRGQGRGRPPVRFGSVGGGGRYDGLVARFGRAGPGDRLLRRRSRLLAALRAIKCPIVAARRRMGPVVVLVLDRDRWPATRPGQALRDGDRRRALSRRGRHERAAQICRQARRRLAVIQGSNERDCPAGRRSWSAISRWASSSRRRTRIAPITSNFAPRRKPRSRKPKWSRRCGR